MNMQRSRRGPGRLRKAALPLAMLSLLPMAAQAARLDYDLGIAVTHSDNVGYSEFNEVSDTIVSPQLVFDAQQAGSTLQFLVNGDIRYPHYLDNTFKDEIQGALSGTLNWDILPQRISFQASDNLSRQSVNVLNSFVPNNQQQVNVFTAGPSFHARFNEVTDARLELLYTNTYAEESAEFQGDRYSATAELERQLRSTDRVVFNLGALQTHNDAAGAFFDYTRYDGYVSYLSSLASIDIELDAGYSQIKPKNYSGSSSSPLFRGNLDWRVAPRTTLSAGFLYEFADAAQNLAYRQNQTDLPPIDQPLEPGGIPIGAQTFRQRRVLLGYRFVGERLTLQVNPYYERIRYLVSSTEDQDVKAISASAEFRLRPGLALSVAAVRQEREYGDIARDDTSTVVNVGLSREMSRHWLLRGYYQRSERDSSSPTQSYLENSLMLSLTYRR